MLKLKNEMVSLQDYPAGLFRDRQQDVRALSGSAAGQPNAMDFDDLLVKTATLLLDSAAIRARNASKWPAMCFNWTNSKTRTWCRSTNCYLCL